MTRSPWLAVLLLAWGSARADEFFVAPGGSGDGSVGAPFGTIANGLSAAMPGDTVTVASGTYAETVTTVRAGSLGLPITLRAAPGASVTVSVSGRTLNLNHAYTVVEGIVFDAQYAFEDAVKVQSAASHSVLRNVEVRRAEKDCIDMISPADFLIEGSRIHHCLNAAGGRTDAHGIVAAQVVDFTIRNTEIHTFSGDAIQIDPDRIAPGWDRVTVEGCHLWLEPLPAPENGFAAGAVPGENAFDTKVYEAPPRRSILTVRNTVAHGFRSTFIANSAAFNMKESVDATFDGVTIYDSEIAFRTRGPAVPSLPGPAVTVRNAVIYDVDKAFRYEDDIRQLHIYNSTLGRNVGAAFQAASSNMAGLEVKNLLFIGATRPTEAPALSNLPVTAAAFVDAAADDYHLAEGSPALNVGETLASVATDRDGQPRPQGSAYDVGAYERSDSTTPEPPDAGTPGAPDGGAPSPDPEAPGPELGVVTGCSCMSGGHGGAAGVAWTGLLAAALVLGAARPRLRPRRRRG